jgi:hypothetical protein
MELTPTVPAIAAAYAAVLGLLAAALLCSAFIDEAIRYIRAACRFPAWRTS